MKTSSMLKLAAKNSFDENHEECLTPEVDIHMRTQAFALYLNMIRIDRKIVAEEISAFERFLEESNFTFREANELLARLYDDEDFDIDYEKINTNEEYAISVLDNLVFLAKCDSELHELEKDFLSQAAKQLKIEEVDVAHILEKY